MLDVVLAETPTTKYSQVVGEERFGNYSDLTEAGGFLEQSAADDVEVVSAHPRQARCLAHERAGFRPPPIFARQRQNAPEIRGRFDIRAEPFDVPVRPPFAPSPAVARSGPWCRS